MEKFMYEKKCGWLTCDEKQKDNIFDLSQEYISFLNQVKTEREATKKIICELEQNNFRNINNISSLKAGDKIYFNNHDKSIFAAIIGDEDIKSGINVVGAHIDSPRLDLKPNPLYEDGKLALFKTHYYGGIKKYQWTTIPLSLHGVVIKPNGEKIEIAIGEEENDPVFTITDLLPHLAIEQVKKPLKEGINGESLNVLIGSIPKDEDKNAVKRKVMEILNQTYGIEEIDFGSSELELVPAFKARHLGFDRSMIAAYGHDDRVCAYALLKALTNINKPQKTVVGIFADKEEIGSVGNTSMQSDAFDYFMNLILDKLNQNSISALSTIYYHSRMLSADVGAGVDPNYQSVSELHNSSFIGYGIELQKYTGSSGKSGASDANAEFMAYVRNIFEKNHVTYQMSELGKVDIGGGGTIAFILANKGMQVVDCGIPVISMHSPFEVISKYDLYQGYLAYKSFLETK